MQLWNREVLSLVFGENETIQYLIQHGNGKTNDSSCEIEYYDSGAYDVIMSIIAHDGDDYVEDIQVQEKIYSPGQRETIYNWVRESGL